jgi:hypothetical protein
MSRARRRQVDGRGQRFVGLLGPLNVLHRARPIIHPLGSSGFFISIFFISVFYKNIFSIWKFTEIYHGRPAGFIRKKTQKIIADRSLGPVARLQGGRLSHLYIRVGWSPHPSFATLQFQKPRKKREGGREVKPCRIFEPATVGN